VFDCRSSPKEKISLVNGNFGKVLDEIGHWTYAVRHRKLLANNVRLSRRLRFRNLAKSYSSFQISRLN
jgi:hypothetical protein